MRTRDLDELERRIDLRFEKVDARFDTMEARFDAKLERGLREQTNRMLVAIGLMTTVLTTSQAIIFGLLAR